MRIYALLLGILLTTGYGAAAELAVTSLDTGRQTRADPAAVLPATCLRRGEPKVTLFGTTFNNLTLSEAAMLAGIVPAPSRYDPRGNPDGADNQRRLSVGYNKAASLVERMEQEGVVGAPNHSGKRAIRSVSRTHARIRVATCISKASPATCPSASLMPLN